MHALPKKIALLFLFSISLFAQNAIILRNGRKIEVTKWHSFNKENLKYFKANKEDWQYIDNQYWKALCMNNSLVSKELYDSRYKSLTNESNSGIVFLDTFKIIEAPKVAPLAISAQNQMATKSGKTFHFVFNKIEENNLVYELPNDSNHTHFTINYDSVKLFTYSQPKLVQYLSTYPKWDKKARYIEDINTQKPITQEPIKIYTAGDYLKKAANNEVASMLAPVIAFAVGGLLVGSYFIEPIYGPTKSTLKSSDVSVLVIGAGIAGTGVVMSVVFKCISISNIYKAGKKLNEKPIE